MKRILVKLCLFFCFFNLGFSIQGDLLGFTFREDVWGGFYSTGWGITDTDALRLKGNLGFAKDMIAWAGLEYSKVFSGYSLKAGFDYLGADKVPLELFIGLELPMQEAKVMAGAILSEGKSIPYLLFNRPFGQFLPFIKLSDKISVGLSYGFGSLEPVDSDNYFSLITPLNNTVTDKSVLTVKGYFFDTGKVFFEGEELSLRADGMFQKDIEIKNIGKNDLVFQTFGVNSGERFFTLVVNKISSDKEEQIPQLLVSSLADLYDKEYFNIDRFSDSPVSKAEFYSVVGSLLELDKENYLFKDLFLDVDDEKLKQYLSAFYGKGLIKTKYKQFNPEDSIRREEAFTVLARIIPDDEKITQLVIADVPTNNWLYDNINELLNKGVVYEEFIDQKSFLSASDMYAYLDRMVSFWPLLNKREIKKVAVFPKEELLSPTQYIEATEQQLNFLAPTSNIRVEEQVYVVKGFGPSNHYFTLNNQKVFVNKLGRFAESVDLKPGLNQLNITIGGVQKSYAIMFRKIFNDILPGDPDKEDIEKLATITGYRLNSDSFLPEEFLTKEEVILYLISAKVMDPSVLIDLENGAENISYNETIKLINSNYQMKLGYLSTEDELITRRQLIKILIKVPVLSEAVKSFYKIKNVN